MEYVNLTSQEELLFERYFDLAFAINYVVSLESLIAVYE